MTDKQRLFIEAYLKTWNATRAAIEAGYSAKTAYSMGSENLKKPEIASAISERIAERAMSADEVLDRLAQQARGSIEDLGEVSKYGTFEMDLAEAKKNGTLHLIKRIEPAKRGYKVELYDAQAALTLLGKHHKLFTEKLEIDDTGLSDEERAARIAALFDRARERRAGSPAPGIENGGLEATGRPAAEGAGE